ncbi:MAG TPA: PilZ domain-containing protein [Thermodesulfovibrionales bacterium]|nr:PilZ domain-containing protein [Thermodesulfovibrionales bacterium]
MKTVILPQDIRTSLDREKSFLSRSDVRMFATFTNRQALDCHREERADLIIANLDTPDMNGETLCLTIREDDMLRDVSIIIVSPGDEAGLNRCLDCRANAFLTLPVNGPVLLQEAHQLLHIAPRRAFRIPLRVKIGGTTKNTSFTGFVENVSTSGMLVRTAAVLFEGDSVVCTFSLPGLGRITTDTEVVRLLPREGQGAAHRYGVRFTDPGSVVPIIEGFVTSRSGEHGGGAAFVDFRAQTQEEPR